MADACRESRGENSEEHLTKWIWAAASDQLLNPVRFRFLPPAQPTTDGTTSSPNIRSSPALKPGLRVLADGWPWWWTNPEPISFCAVGNGVVPLQAATAAFVPLLGAGLAETGRSMNYYEHHIGDYAQATAHLSFVEDGPTAG